MRPDSFLHRSLLIAAGTAFTVGLALAAPAWQSLTSSQQALIKPALLTQGGDFNQLPEARRTALVKGADRWLAMTPQQRTTATQQFNQWQLMSAAEKVAVLQRRERFRKLTPDQRKALLDTQKQFLEMPLQKQQELQDQFKDLQPQLDTLPSQPFATPGSPSPGTTAPLGLPTSNLPNSPNLPILPH